MSVTFGDYLRGLVGTDQIITKLTNLEDTVATAKDQITELRAAVVDYNADVDAKLDQLLEKQGTLDPEAQAVFDDLKATVAAADTRIGDADGSDTPPVEPPTEPTEPTV